MRRGARVIRFFGFLALLAFFAATHSIAEAAYAPFPKNQTRPQTISDFSPKSAQELLANAAALRAPQMEAFHKMRLQNEYEAAKRMAAYQSNQKSIPGRDQGQALRREASPEDPENAEKPKKKVIYNKPAALEKPNKVFRNYR